jgi:putative ABC transport system permease protein
VNTSDISNLLSTIEDKWKSMAPGLQFSYEFMDDSFDQIYRKEQRVGKIAITFTILAILIACLGLFGLVTYSANQRVKEIGIRKVLGASNSNIVNMLSKDFLKLVLVALLISFPLAWWTMYTWLQDFAYRVNISWWIFFVAAIIAIFIAWVTVSLQALRAALANPVKNLRTE